ncbi:DMT family transporter [Streptomyces flavofungini]|uniref:DMT family transporter n=1 Tax=Streptomyces flavofungini TaxID=68200 RepID=UPI0025B151DC|nr:DMT family transporter [Streptomyces flavofungini]WJV44879.1 DMT family transporter [Streptomyces flavofungini]
MSALALSIVLSLISAVAYAGGAIIQEQVAAKSALQQYAPLRNGAWWVAVVLNGLGGLLHVVALAYGPLSLVQPLGALTIVFALPMAALFVRRKAGSTAWRGAIMATVGLVGLLSLTQATASQSLADTERVGLALGTGGAVVTLMLLAHAAHRHPAVRGMLLATAAGIAFGISSVFTKTVAVDWDAHEPLTRQVPSLAVIAVLAVSGLLLSQASYRGAGLAAPLSAVTVVNPVIAAAVGLTLFGESFRYGTAGTAVALACGVVAAGGLILLTTERIGTPHESDAPATASQGSTGTAAATQPLDRPLTGSADDTDVTTSPSPAAARTADDPAVTEQRRPGHDELPLTEPGRRPLTGEQPAPEQHLMPEPLTAVPLQPSAMDTTFLRASLTRPAWEQHSVP